MPQLQFTFDTGAVPLARIVNAICLEYGYQAQIDGVDNPETKANFARRMIGQHIKGIVRNQELEMARKSAEASAVITLD